MKNVIYKISNNINNKIYIGSSRKFNIRCNQHKFHLIKGTHHSNILQNHVNKYGFESLKFEIIEQCDSLNLINREQYYIDLLEPFFNIRRIAESNFGLKRTDEQKKRMIAGRLANSGIRKGWKHTKESLMKIGLANKGRVVTNEQKEKQRLKMIGRKVSNETKVKISKANLGKLFSIETKDKLSISKTGVNNPMFNKFGEKHHNFGKTFKHKNPKPSKKIIDINTNIIYESAKKASQELNIPFGTFAKYLLNYTKKITNFKYYEG